MKSVPPSHLALAASVPVALIVIWWVYKRKSGHKVDNSETKSTTHSDECQSRPSVQDKSDLDSRLQSIYEKDGTLNSQEKNSELFSSQFKSQSPERKLSSGDQDNSAPLGDHYLDIEPRIFKTQEENHSCDVEIIVNPPQQSVNDDSLIAVSKDEDVAVTDKRRSDSSEDMYNVSNGDVEQSESFSQKESNEQMVQNEHIETKLYTETNVSDNDNQISESKLNISVDEKTILPGTDNTILSEQEVLSPVIPATSETFENANGETPEPETRAINVDSVQLSETSIKSQENDITNGSESKCSPVLNSSDSKNYTSSFEDSNTDSKNAVMADDRNGSYTPDSLISDESTEKTEASTLSNQSSEKPLNNTNSSEESDTSNKNNNNNQDRDGKSVAQNNDTNILESTNGSKDEINEDSKTEDDNSKVNGDSSPVHSNGLNDNNSDMQPHNGPSMEYENKEEAQLYLEFPSEKVGLLIGKMGRNIKQLKQDSGAEIMVHTVPFREDIQVLQLTGSHSAVDIAASKIGRKFREVPLTEFDPASCMGFGTQGSMLSSPGVMSPIDSPISPPTFAYPVPEMTQLRIPEGIPVEVVVSAIADCDCIFVQQYTHPTFHALASLEHAMSACYSSPSTPALLSPVQVGLVCVAEHQDVWYRAQVIHANEDSSEITIKFVDYGGYSTVPTSTVKQIRADFITLPFQAAECYLDNIAPIEGDKGYNIESTTVLQELLKEGEFHARISRYRQDGIPYIRLFKRHNNVTALVNELLVNEKVARWVDDETDCMAGVVATT